MESSLVAIATNYDIDNFFVSTIQQQHEPDISPPHTMQFNPFISALNLSHGSSPISPGDDSMRALPGIGSFFPDCEDAGVGGSSTGSMDSGSEDEPLTYIDLVGFQPQLRESGSDCSSWERSVFEDLQADMDSWKYKHPEEWGSREILDWIYTWFPKLQQPNQPECRGENFSNLSGQALINMSEADFCKLEPTYGSTFYQMFHQLLKNSQFAPATFDQLESLTSDDIKKLIDDDIMLKESGIYNYDYDPEDLKDFDVPDPGYESTSSSNLSYPQVPTTVFQVGTDELSVSATLTHQLPGYRTDVTSGAYAAAAQQKEKAPLSRPRMRAASDCSSDGEVRAPPKKRGRRQGQLSKGNHLWEFIRDLLLDPVTNPSVIRWEDEENGVFRIVNSKRVSELWGNKKSNPGMNYEKLSRAMRHYYKSEILEAVLGRRLVYRFGKNSSGWQRTKTESR